MITVERIAAIVLAAGLVVGASAAEVYRWVDDKGVTNMSDVVPEKYKKVAQRVEVPADDAARPDAVLRAAAGASAPSSASTTAPVGPRRISPTPAAAARSASAGSLSSTDDRADCATLQRRYKEAQDCLGPRPHTVTGGVNGARAPQCPIVVDPSPQCGLAGKVESTPASAP